MNIPSADDPSVTETRLSGPPGFSPVVWGMFLGMSWTWVIGMFLPVLLIRDYGQLAWWVFAIPNCLGAAAMGFVLGSSADSERYQRRHAAACRLFSLVTIAFHLFFAAWMLPGLVGPAGWIVALAAVQLAFTPALRRTAAAASIGVFAVSVAAASVMALNGALELPSIKEFPMGSLSGLALVCLLGFICCPYLDLTFHQARQATTPAGGRVAFATGFCGFFAAMIVLTLFYADRFNTLPAAAAWAMVVHMGVQLCFTVNMHAAALHREAEARDALSSMRLWLALALAIGLAAGTVGRLSPGATAIGLAPGEILYRCFMSFYGLVAPAYVLIALTRGRFRWAWVGIIVAIAAPAYWIAFVNRQMSIAIIGATIVLAASALSFATRGRGRATRNEAASPDPRAF